ncbi:hypothetical protein Tco_0246352 [Tanacetum coccineum]
MKLHLVLPPWRGVTLKAIYGLKQASRSWYLCFHEKVTQFGFFRSGDESCIYVKVSGSVVVFLNPGEGHWTAVKNILKYLRNTKDKFLVYGEEKDLRNEGAVTWKSSKQDTVADSACKSEYIAACEASKEAIWMKNLVGDLGVVSTIQDPIEILCDNENAVTLTKEPKDHVKSKHIKKIPFCSKQSRRRIRDCEAHTIRVIIMAQQQHAADVHPDELCPPNKRYDLMDANKKVDLEHVQCPPESKILMNIIKNHPLRFSIAWLFLLYHGLYGTVLAYFKGRQIKTCLETADEFFSGTRHRTPSAPRSPNPKMDTTESSAPKQSTVIHFRLPERRSARLTPPAPVPTIDKEDEMILQDTLQDKEVEITNDEEVEVTNVAIPVNVNEDEEEITDEVYELKRREKGKIVEESRSTPFPPPISSPRIHTDLVSSDTEKLQELTELRGRYTYLFEHLKARFLSRKSFDTLADHLQEVNENEQGPSTSENQEQEDDYDFWTESYASDDDEIPTKQMSQDIMEEVSLTIDEAKLKKMVDEIKEILVSPHPRKTTPLVQSCQRDPEAPPLSLINQDLLYLKKGSSGPEKIVLSLHKFPVIIFNDDDIEEQTSRWSSVIWERVHDFQLGIESYQQKVNLTAPTISFLEVKKHKIVLEGLRSYNNDVKYGYIQRDLTNEEVEYLKLFEEEIEVRLKYRNQMRR